MPFKTMLLIAGVAISALFAAIPTADTVSNSIGMKFKRIPAGTFQMGFEGNTLTGNARYAHYDIIYNKGVYNEYPRHSVTISKDFYMGVYEVTNAQFNAFKASHGTIAQYYNNAATVPVHMTYWVEADSFCKWLTAHDPNGWTYRLPTEAEWEYCCRAGTATPYSTGDSITATQASLCIGYLCALTLKSVGSYAPNPWGLYDMHGNVDEWCLDWYGPYPDSALTDPAGYVDGDLKVVRANSNGGQSTARSAARSANITGFRRSNGGLRVVISDNNNLNYLPANTALLPYQRNVAQSLPMPGTIVSSERYSDQDGNTFNRVRMSRYRYTQQIDSVVYVSMAPIAGDSGADRKLAGLHARNLSIKYGVLYRISNRYELYNAGIKNSAGNYYLTILPDIKYSNGQLHADVAASRSTTLIGFNRDSTGPLYNWTMVQGLVEAPNGDLLALLPSDVSENTPFASMVIARFRNGATKWDSTGLFYDIPLVENRGVVYNDGKGRLVHYGGSGGGYFCRTSDDNGVTWSHPVSIPNVDDKENVIQGFERAGQDTLVIVHPVYKIGLSVGGALTWKWASGRYRGIETSHCLLDNRSIMVMARAGNDSVCNLRQISTNFGTTWTSFQTPFIPFPGCCANHSAMVKLQSGRIIISTQGSNGTIIGESIDQGATWFVRKTNCPGGYRYMMQARDGVIHLIGEAGTRPNGNHPVLSFTEQWLREGTCLNVSQWGVNIAGTLTDYSNPANLEPSWFDTALTTRIDKDGLSSSVADISITATPNPFNPSMVVEYSLPVSASTTYYIYGVSGRIIRCFSLGKALKGKFSWNGKDGTGNTVPTGMYIGRLVTNDGREVTHRLMLMK